MIIFSSYVSSAEAKFWMGFSCAITVVIGVGANLIMLIIQPIRVLKRKCKLYSARVKQKKQQAK